MHLQGGTNRSKCTFCSHSLERVRFKSREVSSDERLRGGGGGGARGKQDWREKVNILARLYEIKQRQLLIHPSCDGSCKTRERKKKAICLSVHQALTSADHRWGTETFLLHSFHLG